MTDPSRWIATQAVIFLPTLFGSTRHYMMKGVPPFLKLISLPVLSLISLPANFPPDCSLPPDFSGPESLAITVERGSGLLMNPRLLSDDFDLIVAR